MTAFAWRASCDTMQKTKTPPKAPSTARELVGHHAEARGEESLAQRRPGPAALAHGSEQLVGLGVVAALIVRAKPWKDGFAGAMAVEAMIWVSPTLKAACITLFSEPAAPCRAGAFRGFR